MINMAQYLMGRDREHGHLLGTDLRRNAARTIDLALQPWRRGRARLDQRVVCARGSRCDNGLHGAGSS